MSAAPLYLNVFVNGKGQIEIQESSASYDEAFEEIDCFFDEDRDGYHYPPEPETRYAFTLKIEASGRGSTFDIEEDVRAKRADTAELAASDEIERRILVGQLL